ncbi:hypothetical protein cypCar_00009387 [Cyprinus carpio]|nr:hypothetical protein cypCar_00009387 [Cyprinus carpio]
MAQETTGHFEAEQSHNAVLLRVDEMERVVERERRQVLNEEFEGQRSELSSALHSEALKADHGKLQQSSTVSLETAVNHQQMLERSIQRLQGELSCAVKDGETLREERDQIKRKVELCMVNSALQKQKEDNKELMESLAALEHQQVTHRQIEQMLWDLTDSENKLAYEKGKLQTQRKSDTKRATLCTTATPQRHVIVCSNQHYVVFVRLQAMLEIQRLEAEVENHNARNNEKLKKALNDASAKSGDLSRANQELREKVSELEKLVSNQKSRLSQYLDNRTALKHSLRIKEYKRRSYEQSQSLLQLRSEMFSLQSELQCLYSTQQAELQAERDLSRTLQEKCWHLEESLKRLQDEAEVSLREVYLESQQNTQLCLSSPPVGDKDSPSLHMGFFSPPFRVSCPRRQGERARAAPVLPRNLGRAPAHSLTHSLKTSGNRDNDCGKLKTLCTKPLRAVHRLQRRLSFGFSFGIAGDPLCGNALSHASVEGQAEEGVVEGQKGAQTGHAGGAGAGDNHRSTDAHLARAAHRPLRLRGDETRSHRVKRLQIAKSPLPLSFSFISPCSFTMQSSVDELDTIIQDEWIDKGVVFCVMFGVC